MRIFAPARKPSKLSKLRKFANYRENVTQKKGTFFCDTSSRKATEGHPLPPVSTPVHP